MEGFQFSKSEVVFLKFLATGTRIFLRDKMNLSHEKSKETASKVKICQEVRNRQAVIELK